MMQHAKAYLLQKLEKTVDSKYKQPIERWADVCIIDVTVNEEHKNTADADGTLHNVKVVKALTYFEALDPSAKYRIKNPWHQYEITSAITCRRRTQLTLKEVKDGHN